MCVSVRVCVFLCAFVGVWVCVCVPVAHAAQCLKWPACINEACAMRRLPSAPGDRWRLLLQGLWRKEGIQGRWRQLIRHLTRQRRLRRLWGGLGNVLKRYRALDQF